MAPGWSETPFLTNDRATFWLGRYVVRFRTLTQVLRNTDRAEKSGSSFAKLFDAVVRNVHTTADRLQLCTLHSKNMISALPMRSRET